MIYCCAEGEFAAADGVTSVFAAELSRKSEEGKTVSSSTRMCLLIIQIAGLSVLSSPSHAIDLTGAWATDQTVCEKLFVKKGKSIAFRPDAVMRGSGFIIDGNSIRGKAIKCAIKTRREEGQVVHLRAGCASDLLLSEVQFSVRIIDDNRINRIFPGMEGIEQAYERCRL